MTSIDPISIAGRLVGPGAEPLIIGEVAQAHDGSLGMAHAFIDAIAAAGAHAVKFQTHIAAAESTAAEPWRVKFSRQDASRYDYWKRMEFTPEQWGGLKQHAEEKGLLFLSSPFSIEAVELLARLDMAAWKVASGEVGNSLLLERIAQEKKPVLLSSGLSGWAELDAAVSYFQAKLCPLAVFQCTTAYPCPAEQIGLNLLAQIRERYRCPVGLSDHSATIYAGLGAVALGADLLEVHVTLSRDMFGPDVCASLTPIELKQLVEGARFIRRAIDSPIDKDAAAKERAPLAHTFGKSLVARIDLPAGTVLEKHHLTAKKPGNGLAVNEWPSLIGCTLLRDVAADEPLQKDCVRPMQRR
jgi:N-acetylneuraminate synthase